MAKLSEIVVGKVFGRLTVVGEPCDRPAGSRLRKFVECLCQCGVSTQARLDSLGGAIVSCGCLNAEQRTSAGKANKTHGMALTSTYKSWAGMWARCTNPNNPKYELYKTRTPPKEWRSYEKFFEDMGEKPEGLTLERKDNNLPYSKENCLWASKTAQSKNTSRVHKVLYKGQQHTLPDLCKLLSINTKTVTTRLYQLGWTLEKALGLQGSEVRWIEAGRADTLKASAEAYVRPDRTPLVDVIG